MCATVAVGSASFQSYAAPLASVAGPVVGALLLALVGRGAYYRQKTCEHNYSRYLTGGVELVAQQIDELRRVFFMNYERALYILQLYTSNALRQRRELISPSAFLPMPPRAFDVGGHYAVRRLLGTNALQQVYQSFHARVGLDSNFIVNDMCSIIQLSFDEPDTVTATPQTIDSEYRNELWRRLQRLESYASMSLWLQALTEELERTKFRSRDIRQFAARSEAQRVRYECEEFLRNLSEADREDAPPLGDQQVAGGLSP